MPSLHRRTDGACVGALISPLVDHVKRVELVVVVLIEPPADEIEDPKAGPPRLRQGVNHELRNGFFGLGVGLVVQNMNRAMAVL
jgi:hypothetical protein